IEIAIQNVQKIQVIQGGIKKTGFQIQAIFSVLITLIAVIWNIITRQMYVSVFLVFMLALKFFILISFFSTIIKYKTDKL
ncbi:hypothetical protein, partial [uncultured Treponema sp.]